MAFSQEKRTKIKNYILKNIEKSDSIVSEVAEKFKISRQTVHRYIKGFEKEGIVESSGSTRAKQYSLAKKSYKFSYDLKEIVSEDVVWKEDISKKLDYLKEENSNSYEILEYSFNEMFNNVISHSEAESVLIWVTIDAANISVHIVDDGIGIFNKIKRDFKLENVSHAILELAKGRITSDPSNHSGEGIFFTSRMVDFFAIFSGNLSFSHTDTSPDSDFITDNKTNTDGTHVAFKVSVFTEKDMYSIFDMYTSEGAGFDVTNVPLRLMQLEGENLVSRSQAKRLLTRLSVFNIIVLDFKGVERIGQAFADEIFRIYFREHENVKLVIWNSNDSIKKMIKHVRREDILPDRLTILSDKSSERRVFFKNI